MSALKVVEFISDVRARLDAERSQGRTVGFVPTMGFLHEGHASLMRRARIENDVVLVSVFVNPLQFGPKEDFADYPRDFDRDLALCEREGVDLVFHPSVGEMYPDNRSILVTVGPIGSILEGATRPGHFDGVATVVSKLFNIAGACRAYFGKKDAQQLVVVERLARGLDFPVDVVGCETVREPDGLAMSSRNVYLRGSERHAATVLKRALDEGARLLDDGEDPPAAEAAMAGIIGAEPLARLDYAVCVDAVFPEEPAEAERLVLLAVAAWVGKARLIDNMTVSPAPSQAPGRGPDERASIRKG
jgi:pantoate--beta-alanine ligase